MRSLLYDRKEGQNLKRLIQILSVFCIGVLLFGCAPKEAFSEIDIDALELQDKLEAKEDFVLIIEREGCTYCEALDAYIEQTQDEHAGLVLYHLDSTDFELSRKDEEGMTLVSNTEEGNILLEMAPYFLYTPTLYKVEDGKAVEAGVGYNESTHEVSLWDVDSTIDFDKAKGQDFWQFVQEGQSNQEG